MSSLAELQEAQRRYYRETAAVYDRMHAEDEAEQLVALRMLSGLFEPLGIRSVLDVGAGTGRAARYFAEHGSDVHVHSAEPVLDLMRPIAAGLSSPRTTFSCASGDHLPFGDQSFDAVCEFAVLHHVPNPEVLIREMMRVARKAIFLSDSNRFGQGPWPVRWLKLALWKAGLWTYAFRLRTGGRGYVLSEGDGLAYSYSVYDSYDQLMPWSRRILAIPTATDGHLSWFSPLMSSSHVLLCALRE